MSTVYDVFMQIPDDMEEDEAYVSSANGQSRAQRAVHVATRKPGKRRTPAAAAAAGAAGDADDSGTYEELQRRLVGGCCSGYQVKR